MVDDFFSNYNMLIFVSKSTGKNCKDREFHLKLNVATLKEQYITSVTASTDNDSARENFECLMCQSDWLIIQDIFVTQKFAQDIRLSFFICWIRPRFLSTKRETW